jgi:cell division transport system permease protein
MRWASLAHRMRYFCADAWDEWRHNKAVNVLALATLASALFLAGLFMLIVSNIEGRVQRLRNNVRVEIYLTEDHSVEMRHGLAIELAALEHVRHIDYVSKDAAMRRYREWAADLAELVSDLETNPLPASLEVFLVPGEGAAATAASLAESLRGREGVEEVRFNQEWLERLQALLELARVGGTSIAILVFAAVLFVMAAVLRLAVFSRRDEIDIMRLVGATPAFIRGPFLVAGLVQGLTASILALALVEAVRAALLAWIGSGSLAPVRLVAANPLSPGLSAILILLGLVVSLAGSWFAVRRNV